MAANMAIWHLLFIPLLFLLSGCSSDVCGPINYDIDPLKLANMWWFETDNFTDCNRVNTSGSTCVVFFSVCHQVPTLCPSNSGICVVNRLTLGSKFDNATFYSWPTKIGSFKGFKFNSEKNSFSLNLPSESPQDHSTLIIFKCKETVAWKTSLDSHGVQVPEPPSISFDKALNQYIIMFNASLACEKGGGGGGGGGGGDTDDAHPLSVGSIMLILFFPGLFLYFVVGILINRGAGKTGKEMIPHSKFWMSLPGLIMILGEYLGLDHFLLIERSDLVK